MLSSGFSTSTSVTQGLCHQQCPAAAEAPWQALAAGQPSPWLMCCASALFCCTAARPVAALQAFAVLQRAQTILLEHLEENPQADASGGACAAQGVPRPSRGAVQAVELPASWHLLLPPALVAAYGRNPLLPFLALRLPQVAFVPQQPAGSGPVPSAVSPPTPEAAGAAQAPAGAAAADACAAQADLGRAEDLSDDGPGDSGQPTQSLGDPTAAQPCPRLRSPAAAPSSAEGCAPGAQAGSSSPPLPRPGPRQRQSEPGHADSCQQPQVEQGQAAGSQQRGADGPAAPLDDQGHPLVRLALLVPCRVAMRGKFPLVSEAPHRHFPPRNKSLRILSKEPLLLTESARDMLDLRLADPNSVLNCLPLIHCAGGHLLPDQ